MRIDSERTKSASVKGKNYHEMIYCICNHSLSFLNLCVL